MFEIAVAMIIHLFLRGDRSIEQMAGFSIARLDCRKLFREVGTTNGLPLPIIYGARGVDDVRYMEPQHLQSVADTVFDHGSSECSEMSLSSLNSSFFCDFGFAGSMALSTLDL